MLFAKEWGIKTSVFEASNKQCVGARTALSRMTAVCCTKPDYAGPHYKQGDQKFVISYLQPESKTLLCCS